MNLVAGSKCLEKAFLVYFEVEGRHYRKQNLDDLELYLVVPLAHTVADRFDYGVDKHPGQSPVHVGQRFLILRVDAIVISVSIQELIWYQLLNYVQETFH